MIPSFDTIKDKNNEGFNCWQEEIACEVFF